MDIVYIPVSELKQGENKLPIAEHEKKLIKESLENLNFVIPVLIDEEKRIIDGNNRMEIAKEIDETTMVPCVVVKGSDENKKIMSLYLNIARRHLTNRQLFEILPTLYEIVSKQSRQRQAAKKNIVEEEKGTTAEKIAEITGFSDETIRKAIAIHKKAPELVEEIKQKKLSIQKAYEQIQEKKEDLSSFNSEKEKETDETNEKRKEIFSLVSSIRSELMANNKANITQAKITDISLRVINTSIQIVENISIFQDVDKEKIENGLKELLKKITDYFKHVLAKG